MRANLRSGLAGLPSEAGLAGAVTAVRVITGEVKLVWLSIRAANFSKIAKLTLRTWAAGIWVSAETESTRSLMFKVQNSA